MRRETLERSECRHSGKRQLLNSNENEKSTWATPTPPTTTTTMTMTTTPKKSTTRVCEREKASERERKLSLAVVVDVVVVVIIEKRSGEKKLRMRQKVFFLLSSLGKPRPAVLDKARSYRTLERREAARGGGGGTNYAFSVSHRIGNYWIF